MADGRQRPTACCLWSFKMNRMLRNYLTVAWRSLLKNRTSSFINISGLAVGMAVAMLIGLWIWDELSYNKNFENYDRIAQVMQHQISNGNVSTFKEMPLPLGNELKNNYGNNFKYVVMASWPSDYIISAGDKHFSRQGIYMEPDGPRMLSLNMIEGTRDGLKDHNAILLSESTAKAFFGDADPLNKVLKIGNKLDFKVTGIYKDFPYNSEFSKFDFIGPWGLYATSAPWIRKAVDQWDNNSFQIYAQITDNADFKTVDRNIIYSKYNRDAREDKKYKAEIFLHPMRDWHLRSHWDNGIKTGGLVEYVRLFSIIGIFVLLLACINFMNLSTARSEKRAKEVGVRKAIGSLRRQLIAQFFIESLLVVVFAFALSLLLSQLFLPWLDEMADKKMIIPWTIPLFWIACFAFSIITAVISGSYPALYLSSFQPVKVLKGAFRVGRLASLPRKVLVVLQFTISLALIIGTIIVYNQIQYSRNRPIGYNRNGLMMIRMKSPDFYGKFGLLKTELKNNGAINEFAESSSPLTEVWSDNNGFSWQGKDPALDGDFATIWVTDEFGKAVGWQFVEGRDFSSEFKTDSSAVVLNESAVKYMGIKDPVGRMIKWDTDEHAKSYKVIGVIKDMLMESPYEPVKQTIYLMDMENVNWIVLKLNPNKSATESIAKIEAVFKKYIPSAPFDYKFADNEFAEKFAAETRIGQLSTFFAVLAIFISCLGLFGLASFVAEQRTKEIGVRKVLGASVFNLWRMLSKDFVVLVVISLTIVTPTAYFFMHHWLLNYQYRTEISWLVFAASGMGAIIITLLTVSYQSIKAALANPTKSLKTE
jgi:putative ABC transport system permease protein